nr:MAG TPA: hypothetical protein [Caudoviricetes sp.]
MIVIRYNSHFLPLFIRYSSVILGYSFFIVNSLKLKVISLNLKVNLYKIL